MLAELPIFARKRLSSYEVVKPFAPPYLHLYASYARRVCSAGDNAILCVFLPPQGPLFPQAEIIFLCLGPVPNIQGPLVLRGVLALNLLGEPELRQRAAFDKPSSRQVRACGFREDGC